MKNLKKTLAPLCVTATAFCLLALAGCGNSDGLTGGVAATVNGNEIDEDKVTTYIMDIRSHQEVTSDKDWANWLNNNGYTPESLREAVIDTFVNQELEKEAAAENGVEVSDEEVDAVVESMRSNYDSDEAWQAALSSAGLTEDSYRENVYQPMLEEKLLDAVVTEDDAKADDETVLTYVQMYASSLDGMKRSSHILFAAEDEETAQQVLDQINAGADFAELAKDHSSDTGSAENGGDVGWDGLTSFVTAYQEALDGLEKGQTSGLVNSEYGIHIIRCTDVWNAPEEITSLDQVPSEVVDLIRTQMADPAAKQTAYSDYLQKLEDDADIQINDMPANVPYNVDMARYISSSTEETEDASAETDAEEDAEDEDEAIAEDGAGTESEAAESEAEADADAEASTSESSSAAESESSAAEDAGSESSSAAAESESEPSSESGDASSSSSGN